MRWSDGDSFKFTAGPHKGKGTRLLGYNTLESYGRDLRNYAGFLAIAGITDPRASGRGEIKGFIEHLRRTGLSSSSAARALVAVKGLHRFMLMEKFTDKDPTEAIESPRKGLTLPHFLTGPEVEALLAAPKGGPALWWALSSASKIQPDQLPPKEKGDVIRMSCARNEREAVQLLVRPKVRLDAFRINCTALKEANGASVATTNVEVFQVMYAKISQPTDPSSLRGLCPDPLPPIAGPLSLEPEFNHAFWIRVSVPAETKAGLYRATVELKANGFESRVPLELRVYDFTLPEPPALDAATIPAR